MATSVAAIIEKISELKSERAVIQQLISYLSANYRSGDTGQIEMRITRDDHALVPENHIDQVIQKLVEMLEETNITQQEFETWRVDEPVEVKKDSGEEAAELVAGMSPTQKKVKRGTRNQRQDQSPAGDDGSEDGSPAAGG